MHKVAPSQGGDDVRSGEGRATQQQARNLAEAPFQKSEVPIRWPGIQIGDDGLHRFIFQRRGDIEAIQCKQFAHRLGKFLISCKQQHSVPHPCRLGGNGMSGPLGNANVRQGVRRKRRLSLCRDDYQSTACSRGEENRAPSMQGGQSSTGLCCPTKLMDMRQGFE